MKFALRELADLELLAGLPGFGDMTPDVAEAVLDEGREIRGPGPVAAQPQRRRGGGALAGRPGADGRRLEAGLRAILRRRVDVPCPAARNSAARIFPRVLSALIEEMWNGANMAFALCPMLTRGAIEALELRGSQIQQRAYLPKMVSGEWTGTMNLTEPQAGSDLSAVRTRAVPTGDGRYLLTGQKIFITYGEHDLAGNIIHMVLGRVAGAPEGVKGISLFLVPKFLLNEDGTPGRRNDVHCLSIEHKLGIRASPTCVLAYGQNGGAVAELIGEENRGLEYMFINDECGALFRGASRAWDCRNGPGRRALAYARERVQGTGGGGARRCARAPSCSIPTYAAC